jgi:hypothetical protein
MFSASTSELGLSDNDKMRHADFGPTTSRRMGSTRVHTVIRDITRPLWIQDAKVKTFVQAFHLPDKHLSHHTSNSLQHHGSTTCLDWPRQYGEGTWIDFKSLIYAVMHC